MKSTIFKEKNLIIFFLNCSINHTISKKDGFCEIQYNMKKRTEKNVKKILKLVL